jgi:hypothetical protein
MNAEELARILDELGRRLGPTGERVFELTLRYVVTDAIVGTIVSATFLVALLLIWRYAIGRWRRWDDPNGDKVFVAGLGGSLGLAATVLIGALCLWQIGVNVVTILNPEYAAIRELVGTVTE